MLDVYIYALTVCTANYEIFSFRVLYSDVQLIILDSDRNAYVGNSISRSTKNAVDWNGVYDICSKRNEINVWTVCLCVHCGRFGYVYTSLSLQRAYNVCL